MKHNKGILILCLFICALFTISSVCASDLNEIDADDDLESIDEIQTIEETNDDEIICESNNDEIISEEGDGTFQELQDMINDAAENSTITLDKDYIPDVDFYKTNSMGIKINKSLTIDGKGHTLNADGKGRIFYINNDYLSVSLILKNIKFINANTPRGDGGAIRMSNWHNASITNCSFINNTCGDNGGAIYGANCGGSTITNCLFENNTSNRSSGGGGAICFYQCYCPIIDCNFTNNQANASGGAIDWSYSKNSTIINCKFTDNVANASGGAIGWWQSSDFYISNCDFINNMANYAGAVYGSYGGELTACNFEGNKAMNGGAVVGEGSGVVNNCNFTNNVADEAGGAVNWRWWGAPNITDCLFEKNSAPKGGAIYLNKSSENTLVSNCDFINNTADVGGAIYNNNSTDGIVSGCNFIENSALNGDGGAIYSSNGNGNFSSSNFISNSATGKGGAIFNGTAVNCNFENNEAEDGSAIYEGTADACIFNGDSPSGTSIQQPTLTVDNLSYAFNAAKKLTFKLISANGIAMNNRNIVVELYQNNALIGTYNCLSGDGLLLDLPIGSYVAVCKATDFDLAPVNATITVNKIPTTITASAVTAVYNTKKYLVITLKDAQGNLLSNASVSVKLKTLKTYKTNANGQIKILVGKLVPKKYTAVITFNGDSTHQKSTKNVTVKVTKAKAKITAKKKTFKKALKVKKYSIKLKSGKTLIKKARVYLKVKGKTYKAKTNSKGKAIFKIKNLKKRGTFTAKITFKTNAYYKKATKKIKIKIK